MSCVWYEESQDRHYTVLTIYYNQQNTNAAVEISENFAYLDKDFNIWMNCDHVQEQLTKGTMNFLQKIDILPVHPLQKIQIIR